MNRYTKLQAVNRILRAASEAPMSSLDEAPTNETLTAEELLDEYTLEVLAGGIHDNIRIVEREPNENDGKVYLPADVMHIEAVNNDRSRNFRIATDGTTHFVYDIDEDTDEFDDEDIELREVFVLDFETLPRPVQQHIVDKAAVDYEAAVLGDPQKARLLQFRAAQSQAEFERYNSRQRKRTFFDARAGTRMPWDTARGIHRPSRRRLL